MYTYLIITKCNGTEINFKVLPRYQEQLQALQPT